MRGGRKGGGRGKGGRCRKGRYGRKGEGTKRKLEMEMRKLKEEK